MAENVGSWAELGRCHRDICWGKLDNSWEQASVASNLLQIADLLQIVGTACQLPNSCVLPYLNLEEVLLSLIWQNTAPVPVVASLAFPTRIPFLLILCKAELQISAQMGKRVASISRNEQFVCGAVIKFALWWLNLPTNARIYISQSRWSEETMGGSEYFNHFGLSSCLPWSDETFVKGPFQLIAT